MNQGGDPRPDMSKAPGPIHLEHLKTSKPQQTIPVVSVAGFKQTQPS